VRNLALKYRPKTFEDISGQKAVSRLLKRMNSNRNVPYALLFTGPKGSGKTSAARVLGAALNCEHRDAEPCLECDSCLSVLDGTSLDYREIDASSNGHVADIRKLQDDLMYRSPGRVQVIVLDEAHGLSSGASNALLKTLEEAPSGVVFVLISTEPTKILNTVRSRCMSFSFHRITTAEILKRLIFVVESEDMKVDAAVTKYIADTSDGSMRDALMSLDQLYAAGISTAEQLRDLTGNPEFATDLLKAMCAADYVEAFDILDQHLEITSDTAVVLSSLIKALKDVMILQAGGELDIDGPALVAREQIKASLTIARSVEAMRVIWDIKTKLRISEDTYSSLSLVVTMMIQALSDGVPPRVVESKKLTLEDMKAMVG
jgi:DNA polymerase III subunit gamma/tau